MEFLGYERDDGKVGVRNHVVVIPVDDLSNAAAVGVSKLVQGAIALPHPYGRLQFGKDLDLYFHTLIGTGLNPNVAAAIVIGIEPKWTQKIADAISKSKPAEAFSIEGYGDLKTIERASSRAKEYLQFASEKRRKSYDLSSLTFSIKCGESDTTSGLAANPALGALVDRLVDQGATVLFGETSELTGAEEIVNKRFATDEGKKKFEKIFREYTELIKGQGVDLLGSQPTEGNIAGGLSTIEEKALGNVQKLGTKPIVDALDYLDSVTKRGLNFVNTSSAAAEALTLFHAKGSVLHFFTTGQGNVVGHPTMPVIKITGNPKTAKAMAEHIDVDVSSLLTLELTLEKAADLIQDVMLRTLNGRLTSSEVLGHAEFSPTKLYVSA
ncbi:MAG: UxaA family hydrolase [Candidatus Marsarchaeota archaeon]